jgi:hypothetical protein
LRTIGFRSNILFAIAAAFGIVAALGRPWYGPAPPATDAPMEDMLGGIGRAVAEPGGTIGWTALATADQLIAGLAVATAVLLALTLIPSVQLQVQALARWSALATVGVLGFTLLDLPGTTAMAEPRHGLFLALASSLVLLASAWTVASAPVRRRAAPRPYIAPAPPVYERDEASWGPPQF